MDERELINALVLGEEKDWEFKSAGGGLPGSLWETYSAMANTDGGAIVLGVEQGDQEFVPSSIPDPPRMKSDFWSTVNNRGKVSINLLSDEHVFIKELGGESLLVIRVPRAARNQRPVYVGQNPLVGTYRRNFEGDYHCTQEEVGRMLADRSDEPADSRILEGFTLDDLDEDTLKQYRQRFSARSPDHPWLTEDLSGLLEKLGARRRDRRAGEEGITAAGLMMFGKDEVIRDPQAVSEFHLDYREKLSDDPEVRWTDRLTSDGTWVCNLFQFYQKVIQRLTADLKIPFHLEKDMFRKDDTPVHEAIREALVNTLIHADYRGQGGVIVEKYRDRLEMSNPGSLLVSFEQILRGGVSECRNKSIQKMFQMIGGGEQAGSGMDKIRKGWRSQQWRSPRMRETVQPDRVQMVLPKISMLPEESVNRLKARFGSRFGRLKPIERNALVTVDVEEQVSNARMQEISAAHPTDITKMLQGLVSKSFLVQVGQKRGTYYRLSGEEAVDVGKGDSAHKESDSAHKEPDSAHKMDLVYKTLRQEEALQVLTDENVMEIVRAAGPALSKGRRSPGETRDIVAQACKDRYLTAVQIGTLLQRNPLGVQKRFLKSLINEGVLELKYPDEPNRPDQAYTTRKEGD